MKKAFYFKLFLFALFCGCFAFGELPQVQSFSSKKEFEASLWVDLINLKDSTRSSDPPATTALSLIAKINKGLEQGFSLDKGVKTSLITGLLSAKTETSLLFITLFEKIHPIPNLSIHPEFERLLIDIALDKELSETQMEYLRGIPDDSYSGSHPTIMPEGMSKWRHYEIVRMYAVRALSALGKHQSLPLEHFSSLAGILSDWEGNYYAKQAVIEFFKNTRQTDFMFHPEVVEKFKQFFASMEFVGKHAEHVKERYANIPGFHLLQNMQHQIELIELLEKSPPGLIPLDLIQSVVGAVSFYDSTESVIHQLLDFQKQRLDQSLEDEFKGFSNEDNVREALNIAFQKQLSKERYKELKQTMEIKTKELLENTKSRWEKVEGLVLPESLEGAGLPKEDDSVSLSKGVSLPEGTSLPEGDNPVSLPEGTSLPEEDNPIERVAKLSLKDEASDESSLPSRPEDSCLEVVQKAPSSLN